MRSFSRWDVALIPMALIAAVGAAGCDSSSGNVLVRGHGGQAGLGVGGTSSPSGGAGGRGGRGGSPVNVTGAAGAGASGLGGAAPPAGVGGAVGGGNVPTTGVAGAGGNAAAGNAGVGGAPAAGARRLALPCAAPLPTGFCMVSDAGNWIGGGNSVSASGPANVMARIQSDSVVQFDLTAPSAGTWTAEFAAPANTILIPGLYDPAERYPFQEGSEAGLDVYGNGAGCNTVKGRFSVEELTRNPVDGISSISITFEHHCEGGPSALRGVINYQATGTPLPTPMPDRLIALKGKIFRVAYDAIANVAYGLDATNRRLAKIDLASGAVTYADVVQIPNDACVDNKRGRLFVVNKGSTLITEYTTADLKSVRDIPWTGIDWGPTETHFKITCGPDRLYVVDGAWQPGLFTVDSLNAATPVVTDHTAQVAGVGGLALNAAGSNLYFWSQVGWSAGNLNTSVQRNLTADFSMIDSSSPTLSDFGRDPLDAPLLLDEGRGLIFVKNKIFDSMNLAKVVYSLPGKSDVFAGSVENAYALDAQHGLMASKHFVYELTRYDIVAPTLVSSADQTFFDASGTLWFLSIPTGALEAQIVHR